MLKKQHRRKTVVVNVGGVYIGGRHPIVVQSMTNTSTADITATFNQIIELAIAGAEIVRVTINDERAARGIVKIIKKLRDSGYDIPIVGDFHFNGHVVLKAVAECARLLAKYRINPGNLGRGRRHDKNFADIIKIAIANQKPIRIGVNAGSLDRDLLTELLAKNSTLKRPHSIASVIRRAMVESVLRSAEYARKLGLGEDKIVISAKASNVEELIEVNSMLADRCNYPIHVGLTEAGSGVNGIVASSAAASILLYHGIGDTIRVSLTPSDDASRSLEVDVARNILQSLALRYFSPRVVSCPGCGRTDNRHFQQLVEYINSYVQKRLPFWKEHYPGVERMVIAVMGCVVNGPGESKHADIGISLPGKAERCSAMVFSEGNKISILKGKNIKQEFIKILEDYISSKYGRN